MSEEEYMNVIYRKTEQGMRCEFAVHSTLVRRVTDCMRVYCDGAVS